MGIYDRNYNRASDSSIYADRSETSLVNFVKTTYKFFAGSLLLATIGALIGLQNPALIIAYKWPLFFVELGLIFALNFVKDKPGVNVAVFAAFAFISGITLVPLLAFVMHSRGLGVIAQALAMTSIIFGIMSTYALKTSRDLGSLGKPLFWSLIVIIAFALLNAFVFKSPMLQFAIASVMVIVFSLLIAYDTQNIVKGRFDSPIIAAISLYLNVLNLFTALLQILGIFGGDKE